MRLSRFFITRPIFAAVIAVVITIVGAIAYLGLPVSQYPNIVPPTVTVTANYPGATAYHNALDENLVAALTKSKTPEQAMNDTEKEWKKITRRIGEDKTVEAIKTNKAAWPTILD